ncbi:MAG: hypothetical protein ABL999_10275 [Pyrinomonadaceae bacterium]
MSVTSKILAEKPKYRFDFESYGVFVRIESNDAEAFSGATTVAHRSLLENVTEISSERFDHEFSLDRLANGDLMLVHNGVELGASDTSLKAFRFFDSILRVSVGEIAPDRVFLHAAVVGWKGKAIVMPADSFQGKSTLTTELVKHGAEYYSDDFAIIDRDAFVHPFPRRIAMRTEDFKTYDLGIEELGGIVGSEPIPVALVLLTRYDAQADWNPQIETAGSGVLKLIPFTLSIRNRPEFSVAVLHKLASRAIIVSSLRGSAERFAKTLLDFVDNHVN